MSCLCVAVAIYIRSGDADEAAAIDLLHFVASLAGNLTNIISFLPIHPTGLTKEK
jgi:hypothetical protein